VKNDFVMLVLDQNNIYNVLFLAVRERS